MSLLTAIQEGLSKAIGGRGRARQPRDRTLVRHRRLGIVEEGSRSGCPSTTGKESASSSPTQRAEGSGLRERSAAGPVPTIALSHRVGPRELPDVGQPHQGLDPDRRSDRQHESTKLRLGLVSPQGGQGVLDPVDAPSLAERQSVALRSVRPQGEPKGGSPSLFGASGPKASLRVARSSGS